MIKSVSNNLSIKISILFQKIRIMNFPHFKSSESNSALYFFHVRSPVSLLMIDLYKIIFKVKHKNETFVCYLVEYIYPGDKHKKTPIPWSVIPLVPMYAIYDSLWPNMIIKSLIIAHLHLIYNTFFVGKIRMSST